VDVLAAALSNRDNVPTLLTIGGMLWQALVLC
jgi:hypothetical protein